MNAKAIRTRQQIRSGAVPGALGGDLGAMCVPGWPKVQKESQETANPWSLFGTKIETRTSFSWSCSLLIFQCAFVPDFCPHFGVPSARSPSLCALDLLVPCTLELID